MINLESCVAFVFWFLQFRNENKTFRNKQNQQTSCHPSNTRNPSRNVLWKICWFLHQSIFINFTKQHFIHHTLCIYSVAFHKTLPLLATGSVDNMTILYNLTTHPPTIQHRLQNHTDIIFFVAFHPKKPLLATCSRDKTAIIYNLLISPPTIQQHLQHHTSCVLSVAFHPNPTVSLFATSSTDHSVILYDLIHVPAIQKDHLQHHTGFVSIIDFHPRLLILASGSYDSSVILYDVSISPAIIKYNLKQHTNMIYCALFHPQLALFVTGSADNSAILYDMSTMVSLLSPVPCLSQSTKSTVRAPVIKCRLKNRNNSVCSIVFHEKLSLLGTSSYQDITLYDLTTFPPCRKYYLKHCDGGIASCAFHPTSPLLVIGSSDSRVILYNIHHMKSVMRGGYEEIL